MPDTLDFEEPIAALLKEIDTLAALPATPARDREIDALKRRIETVRADLYRSLTPWQRVQVARHPNRPGLEFFIERLFSGFTELHGDRRFADDHAIMTGFADYKGQPVLLVGHVKGAGRDTKEKIFRNFGYARPEGYRKALRTMRLAEKFRRPIVVFVDTPAAYPGIESEERGVAEAIAVNLRDMMMLDTPIIVIVSGEGGSGGALGIAVGDRVLMQEYAIYSVIPPEGCAAILWRDSQRKVEAADALKLTAPDLLAHGIVDEIVPEPVGGAHTSLDESAALLDGPLYEALTSVSTPDVEARLARRYDKFREMGKLGADFTDEENPCPGEFLHGHSTPRPLCSARRRDDRH
jgi:acetyl-CoA carboxylase carboxyl transferase subunit alpha